MQFFRYFVNKHVPIQNALRLKKGITHELQNRWRKKIGHHSFNVHATYKVSKS